MIAATTAAPSAALDWQALLLKKIAARAAPAEATPLDGFWAGTDPTPITPSQRPTESERERDGFSFHAPTFESRFGRKALKTRFSAGGISSRAELGYDGDLRLYLDKPALGGRLSMSFVEDAAGGKLRLEFTSSF